MTRLTLVSGSNNEFTLEQNQLEGTDFVTISFVKLFLSTRLSLLETLD